jgi:uncharacterized membrane protein YfhO
LNVIEDRSDHVIIQVNGDSAGWLVQKATYYPGWTARVDGQVVQIHQADGYLRAVPIPVGEHTVEIRYQPVSFTIGLLVSCLSWILFGWVTIFKKWRMPHGRTIDRNHPVVIQ